MCLRNGSRRRYDQEKRREDRGYCGRHYLVCTAYMHFYRCNSFFGMSKVKCVICGRRSEKTEMYSPPASLRYTCSPHSSRACATTFSQQLLAKKKEKEDKEYRKETKRRKEAINSDDKSFWKKKATTVFHKWVREVRDAKDPCISCGRHEHELKPNAMGQYWDAGHYRTKGSSEELRFEPLNVHKQCKSCNSGSYYHAAKKETVAAGYKRRLLLKIGAENMAWLDGPHPQARLRADDYKAIEAKYKQKLKELEQ
jgi:hypothetical protein